MESSDAASGANNKPVFRCHRGSCLCDDYELRITQRCLIEDLGLTPVADFTTARSCVIVQALENQRSANPIGTKTVGPYAGERTIYRLGHGHDHRGATWYDQIERVVWLCAYRRHRSGDPADAFPYFHHLIQGGRIWPTEQDYEVLFTDQGHRFVETLYEDAQILLKKARFNPGVEVVGVLGGEETAGVVVEVVDTLEETYVAFSVARIDPVRPVIILGAFYVDARFADWELVASFPTRPLRTSEAEVCYRILRG